MEIETHPRGARQSSLSSILSSRSLSAESLGHSKAQSQDHLCASEERKDRGGEKQDDEGAGGGEGTPVFEKDDV